MSTVFEYLINQISSDLQDNVSTLTDILPNWRFRTNAFVSLESAVMTIALLSHYQTTLNIPQALRGHIVLGCKMDAQKDGRELLKTGHSLLNLPYQHTSKTNIRHLLKAELCH